MTKKQVEELVAAYRACEKKEQQMKETFFRKDQDCDYLEEVKEHIFGCLTATLPENDPDDIGYRICNLIYEDDTDGICRLLNVIEEV